MNNIPLTQQEVKFDFNLENIIDRQISQSIVYEKAVPIEMQQVKNKKFIDIAFKNLSYYVLLNQGKRMEKKIILDDIDGICLGGQMTAILGPSGAGKTSLLNLLAQRIDNSKSEKISGQILANSKPYDQNQFASFASYVMQNDLLFETMTPREIFQFAANLKYNDQSMRAVQVNNIIKALKLQSCQHTIVGGVQCKGISGGERKRTSIGVELVSDPAVLLLDEPTSGLDSFTAYITLNLLKKICKTKQKTIIFTIHQPSSDIYQLFDRIILLANGKMIYQGSKNDIVDYFAQIGFQCPQYSNPMDYFVRLMHSENQKNIPYYYEKYRALLQPQVQNQIHNMSVEHIQTKIIETTYGYQVKQICSRAFLNIKRDKFLVRGRFMQAIFLGLFMGGIFYGVGRKPQSFSVYQSINGVLFFFSIINLTTSMFAVAFSFPVEREIFLKEENAKLYTASAYFLGKQSVELPFVLVMPLFQQLISYWMIGLNYQEASIVIIHVVIFMLMSFAGNSLGLVAGCIINDIKIAVGFIPTIMLFVAIFSGFFKNQRNLMEWISWLKYFSPFKYAFEAAVTNQYIGIKFTNMPNPMDVLDFTFGLWQSIVVLIAWIIIYRILALICLITIKSKLQ